MFFVFRDSYVNEHYMSISYPYRAMVQDLGGLISIEGAATAQFSEEGFSAM